MASRNARGRRRQRRRAPAVGGTARRVARRAQHEESPCTTRSQQPAVPGPSIAGPDCGRYPSHCYQQSRCRTPRRRQHAAPAVAVTDEDPFVRAQPERPGVHLGRSDSEAHAADELDPSKHAAVRERADASGSCVPTSRAPPACAPSTARTTTCASPSPTTAPPTSPSEAARPRGREGETVPPNAPVNAGGENAVCGSVGRWARLLAQTEGFVRHEPASSATSSSTDDATRRSSTMIEAGRPRSSRHRDGDDAEHGSHEACRRRSTLHGLLRPFFATGSTSCQGRPRQLIVPLERMTRSTTRVADELPRAHASGPRR